MFIGKNTRTVEELMLAPEKYFCELAVGKLRPFPEFFNFIEIVKEKKIKTALASSAATKVVLHNLKMAGSGLCF